MGSMRVRGCGVLTAAIVLAPSAPSAAQAPEPLPTDRQIAVAVLAAPEDMRDGATVMGYDGTGTLVVLRDGSNDLICLADDPERDGFEVSCHHASVEPYIARGRALRAQGLEGAAVNEARWKEMQQGTLPVPEQGASNYILTGTYDPATGEIADAYLRWNVYTPYATTSTTGLSTRGAESAPWLMFPGTPGAHIMIVPPRGDGGRN